jgi:hypothetical protein
VENADRDVRRYAAQPLDLSKRRRQWFLRHNVPKARRRRLDDAISVKRVRVGNAKKVRFLVDLKLRERAVTMQANDGRDRPRRTSEPQQS